MELEIKTEDEIGRLILYDPMLPYPSLKGTETKIKLFA